MLCFLRCSDFSDSISPGLLTTIPILCQKSIDNIDTLTLTYMYRHRYQYFDTNTFLWQIPPATNNFLHFSDVNLGFEAKDLSFKAKDLSAKAKDLSFKNKARA